MKKIVCFTQSKITLLHPQRNHCNIRHHQLMQNNTVTTK